MTFSFKNAAAVLAAFAAAALAPAQAQAEAAGVSLYGAGATFPAPLYRKWIEEFNAMPGSPAVISYDSVGSGEGVKRFKAGTVDFGASDVPLSPAEAAVIVGGVLQAPTTAGMIVLAYNLSGLEGELKLPQDVYVDIFLGKIKTWDDPRILEANTDLDLPSTQIAVVGRLDSSGTTHAFTNHLAAVNPAWAVEGPGVAKLVEWPRQVMLARGNEGVASRIKISAGSIGYVEYGIAHRLGLPVAALENKAGEFVGPSQQSGGAALDASAGQGLDGLAASVANPPGAGAYPIVTYSWLLLHERYPGDKARALASFVEWGLDKGQAFAPELEFLALPRAVADLGKSALSRIKLGY